MKNKGKTPQKKGTGPKVSPSAKRIGSGGGTRRSGATVPAGSSVLQTATAQITERKREEEALKESEQKYKLLIEATNTGYVIIDEMGRVLDANQEYVRMTGCGRLADILGRPVTDWTASYDRERNEAEVRKCLESGAARHLVIDYVDDQGKATPVEINATVLPGPSFARIFTVCRDITERKRAEDALRESEENFRMLVETSYDWIWAVDEHGIYTYASPRVKGILGYSAEEVIGKTPFDFMPPKDKERVVGEFRKIVAKREPLVALENINRHRDGREVILETSGMPVFDLRGGFKGYRGIDRDITERKHAEAVLRISEERFRKVFMTSPDSINISRLDDGMIISINQGFTVTTGYTAVDVVGRTSLELNIWVDPADRQKLVEGLQKQGEIKNLEARFRSKDGIIIDGLMSASIVDIDHIPHLISVTRDITERKRAELALKQSEEKYRRLYNETPVLLHSIDRDARVVDVNDYWLKTMGYDRSEVIGRKVTDFFTSDARKYSEEVVQPAFFRDGSVKDISYQFVKKNGEVLNVLLSATAERDAAGNVVRSQAVITDITERKRMEEKLWEKESKYRTLFESANDGIFIQDSTGFRDCNQRGAEMYGLPKEKLIGRSPAEFTPERQPDGRLSAEVAGEKIRAALDGVPQVFEWRPLRADGNPFDVEITLNRLEIGGSMFLQAIVRDITERKRTDDLLRQSEVRYRMLYEGTPVMMHSIDAEGKLVSVSDQWLKQLGYTRDEVLGRRSTEFLDERSSIYARTEILPDFMRTGICTDVPYTFVKKNGESISTLLSAIAERDEAGNILRSLAVIIDITERKRVEETLRENKARLDLALQSAHMGVWRWEIKENKRYFDEMTCQVLGIEAATFTGSVEDFYEAVHPEDLDKIRAAIALTIEHDVPYEPSYRVIWRDGSIHYITSRGRLFRENTGQPVRINGILWDITDRHLMEQELIKTQKLESIGTLAGGIAHDFNNFLQGIFGYISMARLTFDQKEKSLAMLEKAEKALHQSVNLTSQLLTFSKGGKPVKKVIDLRPVIENSVAFALSGSHNTYEIVMDDGLPSVEADEGQIGQVIQNIMLNADQSMPLGGRIRVSVRNKQASSVTPHVGLQGDLVEISIRDQGTGIPAEHLTRIFDPYFTTKEKGSGLGLATSYSIIKNHGGLIRVQSEIGKGTSFFVYLPASGSAAEGPKNQAIPAMTRKGRILVMDDEEIVRAVAGELLTALGHEVAFAEKGETALESYRAARDAGRPFDVVILDLTIRGGLGGRDTLRKLMEIDPDVKAVVSSGYSDDAALSNYLDQGFRTFLKKPYKIEDLQGILNALLA
jgi:PAS domain S-box-containing protein